MIGVATKPQALKGQFRIKPNILNLKKLKKLENLTISNIEYPVESITLRETFIIVKLSGVDTCEQAETFRNKQVFADIEDEVETTFDLNGFEVIVDNESLGTIININNYGSKDVITIEGEKSIMLPNIDGLIVSTDETSHKVIFDKNIFETVAVYED